MLHSFDHDVAGPMEVNQAMFDWLTGQVETLLDYMESVPLDNVEVFHLEQGEFIPVDGDPLGTGWYWWICFPGCLPRGPYLSEQGARLAAYVEQLEFANQ